MSSSLLAKIKPFTPPFVQRVYRKYRRWERFRNRFLVNRGQSFIKNILTQGISFKIVINPFSNGCVDDVIAKDGIWEESISQNIQSLLPAHGVFVDIGANIGYHSLFAASLHNRSTQVFAFEPQPVIFSMFTQSVAANNFSNIKIFNAGLSDFTGTAELSMFEENKGASSLTQGITHHTGDVVTTVIDIQTLDSYLEVIKKVDVIKIDVEGFEFDVVRGTAALLKRDTPALLIEFSPGLYNLRDVTIPARFIDFLENLGYSFFATDGSVFDIRAWSREAMGDTAQIDIVCRVLRS